MCLFGFVNYIVCLILHTKQCFWSFQQCFCYLSALAHKINSCKNPQHTCCACGLEALTFTLTGETGEVGCRGDPGVDDTEDTDRGDGTCCCGDDCSSETTTCCCGVDGGCCVGHTPRCCSNCWRIAV